MRINEEEQSLSVFRNEKKFLMSCQNAMALQDKLDVVMHRDDYALHSGYMVRSLYFDSINNIDYMSKLAGVEIRKKIRIRVYDVNTEKCKLEIKQKKGDLQHKISLWIDRNDAVELTNGNYSVLVPYFERTNDAVYIYKTMVMGCYRPVALVEYDRVAYTYPLYNTRITIDMNLRSSEEKLNIFCDKPMYLPLLTGYYVLEVKYNKKLVSFISELLKPYHLTQISVSKYCMGRKKFSDFLD